MTKKNRNDLFMCRAQKLITKIILFQILCPYSLIECFLFLVVRWNIRLIVFRIHLDIDMPREWLKMLLQALVLCYCLLSVPQECCLLIVLPMKISQFNLIFITINNFQMLIVDLFMRYVLLLCNMSIWFFVAHHFCISGSSGCPFAWFKDYRAVSFCAYVGNPAPLPLQQLP